MRALVTGGGGFLGGAIVDRLLGHGWAVRILGRNLYPDMQKRGVESQRGDVAEYAFVEKAAGGCDIVFHVAAKAGAWGPYDAYYRTNVRGTQNVIDACAAAGISRLVYTSSPSVTFEGRDQEGVDESVPYAKRFLAHYPRTKALAERLVLKANSETLRTVALRPHLIWGPGDTQLIPRLLERARAGTLRIVGSGDQKVDATYIDNAAGAHILAAEALEGDAACAGKAYFISNDEPMPIREVINGILNAAALAELRNHVPAWVAYAAGAAFEAGYSLMRVRREPPVTRFIARQLATAHWYNISAAKRDLSYNPTVSMKEGFARLAESMRVEATAEPAA